MPSDWLHLTPRRLLAAVLFVGLFVMAAQPVTDPDLWWHLRTGQWIVDHRAVPHTDPFSFTKFGEHWVAHEWLADVALFMLYQVGGSSALVMFTGLTVMLTFTLIYQLSELRPHVAVFTTLLAALASAVTWGPRPQMLTMLLAALTFLIVHAARSRSSRALWLLPPLIWLWANLHSGYFLGLVIIAATLVGETIEQLLARGQVTGTTRESLIALRSLAVILLLSILAAALNANGLELLIYPFFTLTSKAMQTYIVEWHSADFHDPRFLPFAILLLALLVTFALSRRRPTAPELLLLLGLGYEALVSARNIPLFALVAAPVLSKQIQSLAQMNPHPSTGSGQAPTLARSDTRWLRSERRAGEGRPLVVLNWLLLFVIVLAAAVRVTTVLAGGDSQLTQNFPEGAAAYLLRSKPDGPLLNSYNFGGYLIWRLYPTYSVFIDGRADVYGDSFMDEYYARAWQGRGDWQKYLERYNVHLVLMEKDGTLSSLLRNHPQWRTLYSDQVATVFQRVP